MSSGRSAFQLQYDISPVFLTGGIAGASGTMSIVQLTDPEGLDDLDDAFAHWVVMPGGTLHELQPGTYPFANQAVAANAVIFQPLKISLMMICPANETTPWYAKQQVIAALKATLTQHMQSGGTFSVFTPAFLYTNCLLLDIIDASTGETNQRQYQYQWDFYKPLLTLQDAQAAQNSLISKMTNGSMITNPAWSGNQNPTSVTGSPAGLGGSPIGG